jgi:acyl-CoA synthetase (AMP-forming)/AMP-acid ligase II
MLFRDYVRRAARSYPNKTAFIDGELHRNWASFDERTSRLGRVFQALGVRKGDRVGILAHEHVEVLEHWMAAAKVGAVRVGINWRYSAREKLHLVHDSDMKVLLVEARCVDEFADGIETAIREGRAVIGFGGQHDLPHDYETLLARHADEPDHVALTGTDPVAFSYTTGTTGLPKGAIWTQHSALHALIHAHLNLGLRHEDVWLMPIPMPGVPILMNTPGVISGLTTVLIGGDFSPTKHWELIERHRVTATGGVPTMIRRLLEEYQKRRYDIGSLRSMFYGSSPMPPALIRDVYSTIGCELIQPYGSTEIAGWASYLRNDDHRRAIEEGAVHLLASCGRPSQHCDVKIMDEDGRDVPAGDVGELCVRTEAACAGYHNLPDETAGLFFGEWLRTGDLARIDAAGYIYLVDRRKFMIISGGYNVYPVVVENVLAEHVAVREVNVCGAEHPEWGEAVTAVVSLKEGMAVTAAELIDFVRPKVGRWEVPKHIEIVDDLPKGVTGKIDKFGIRDRFRRHPELLPWHRVPAE